MMTKNKAISEEININKKIKNKKLKLKIKGEKKYINL